MISHICTITLELLIRPKSGLGKLGMGSIIILPVGFLGYVTFFLFCPPYFNQEVVR